MKIPYQSLDPETLQALLEEIITRDGTDYGEVELTLEQKITQALRALEEGKACIKFNVKTETCSLAMHD